MVKQERYLKDDHELKQYMLQMALSEAELVTRVVKSRLARLPEEVAKEFCWAEAIVERLSRIIASQYSCPA